MPTKGNRRDQHFDDAENANQVNEFVLQGLENLEEMKGTGVITQREHNHLVEDLKEHVEEMKEGER